MKYVLVRPEGGLNDMLVQTSRCYDYCLRYGRTLLVDTRYNDSFKDDFSFYFKSTSDILKTNDSEVRDILYMLRSINSDCVPNIDFIDHKSHYSGSHQAFISDENNCTISFDFYKHYDEVLLIHDNCGGGVPDFKLFEKLKLSDHIKNIFFERIKQIESFCNRINYSAVHIRNTDMRCGDIDNFINSLPFRDEPFFISTDDINSLNKVKQIYNVIHFSNISNVTNSMHLDEVDNIEKRSRNIDSVVDLFLLSFSHNLIGSTHHSGYFILAKELMNNYTYRDALFN
jgi:hypothetical protein